MYRKNIKNQKGQSLLEFILLMSVLIFLSRIMIVQINGRIADRWEKIINLIVTDSKTLTNPDVKIP